MRIRYVELFAGLAIASRAIKKVFKENECLFYSEIEKNRCDYLVKTHPGVKNIGDIDFLDCDSLPLKPIDLLVGGSPCQNLSIANTKTREGLDGHDSGLFYQYLELLRQKKPKFFILENVNSMSIDDQKEITRCLGVQPVLISSEYFTGQIRKRLYWCNFPILPYEKKVVDPRWCIDKSVIPDRPTSDFINTAELNAVYRPAGKSKSPKSFAKDSSDWDLVAWSRSTRYFEWDHEAEYQVWLAENPELKHKRITPKSKKFRLSYVEQRIKVNITANTLMTGVGCSIFSSRNYVRNKTKMRMLTPGECAKLQGMRDNPLADWKPNAAYSAIGDAFTEDVMVHIMTSLKTHMENIN